MGGHALEIKGIKTRRYKTDEFLLLWDELNQKLSDLFPNTEFHLVKYYHTKEDHGDMDILVRNQGQLGYMKSTTDVDPIHETLSELSDTIVKNSNVYSFEYKEFQIDFILIPESDWNTSCDFFDQDPTGNLLGKFVRNFGLKYGMNGLSYVYRPSDNYKAELRLSDDIVEILDVMNLNSNKYLKGFNTKIEIFDWFIESPYFEIDRFYFENQNHSDRKRNKRRASYNEFMEYVKLHASDKHYSVDRYNNIEWINDTFPNAKIYEFIKYHDDKLAYTNVIKSKFNGKIIMEMSELRGKELGNFITEFKKKFSDEWIYHSSENSINSVITNLLSGLHPTHLT